MYLITSFSAENTRKFNRVYCIHIFNFLIHLIFLFILQDSTDGKLFYLYQAQGSSIFEMSATSECHYNCTEKPITIDIDPGNIGKY